MLDYDSVKPEYLIPTYLYVGQEVFAPYPQKNCSIRCKVLVACGDAARVVNENYNFDEWFDRYHLRVKREEAAPKTNPA